MSGFWNLGIDAMHVSYGAIARNEGQARSASALIVPEHVLQEVHVDFPRSKVVKSAFLRGELGG
jgi:hypothetical protein